MRCSTAGFSMAIVNSVIVPGLRDHRVIPEFGHGEGYRFIERFGLNMGCMSGGISVDEGDAATGEHLGIINRLSPSIRSQKSASTIRSTNLLFSHGGSHRFESCSAHHRINHLQAIVVSCVAPERSNCSSGVPQIMVLWGNPIHPDRHMGGRNHAVATGYGPGSWAPVHRALRRESSAPAAVAPAASLRSAPAYRPPG